jgi:hypothetical protein
MDVSILSTIGEAEEYLAGVVDSGRAYAAFDAEGRALRVEVISLQGETSPGGSRKPRISLAETTSAHAGDLGGLLRDYLQACGERVGPEATLRDLIRRCRSIHLYRD